MTPTTMPNYTPLTIKSLSDKSILILGLAREGISTYQFLRSHLPEQQLTLADEKIIDQLPAKLQQLINQDPLVELINPDQIQADKLDLIFKSAGIPSDKYDLPIEKFTSNAQLFFDLAPGKIIGVTGTKGKSTTTALIAHVLQTAGLDTRLAGNIGLPLLETLKNSTNNTHFVCELSSHQLELLHSSPDIAVIQPIIEEHLDYHHTLANYINAKANITKYQTDQDLLIFNSDSPEVAEIATNSQANKFAFGFNAQGPAIISNQDILINGEKIISLDQTKLRGQHNLQNMIPSILIANHLQLDKHIIISALQSFKPLPDRLELVPTNDGIEYFNDSLATNPKSTIAAINAFAGKNIILIAGGYDRGVNYQILADKINQSNIKKLILFPDTGMKINAALIKMGSKIDREITDNMADAVKKAKQVAQPGDVVLMSPASASFNLFKDYADRGEQFKKYVQSS